MSKKDEKQEAALLCTSARGAPAVRSTRYVEVAYPKDIKEKKCHFFYYVGAKVPLKEQTHEKLE